MISNLGFLREHTFKRSNEDMESFMLFYFENRVYPSKESCRDSGIFFCLFCKHPSHFQGWKNSNHIWFTLEKKVTMRTCGKFYYYSLSSAIMKVPEVKGRYCGHQRALTLWADLCCLFCGCGCNIRFQEQLAIILKRKIKKMSLLRLKQSIDGFLPLLSVGFKTYYFLHMKHLSFRYSSQKRVSLRLKGRVPRWFITCVDVYHILPFDSFNRVMLTGQNE